MRTKGTIILLIFFYQWLKIQDWCWSTDMGRSSASFIRIFCNNIAHSANTKNQKQMLASLRCFTHLHLIKVDLWRWGVQKKEISFTCQFSFKRHFLLFLNCSNTNINNELKVKQLTDDTVNTEPHVVLAQVRMEMNLFVSGVAEIKFLKGPQKNNINTKSTKSFPKKCPWSKPGKQTKHHFTGFTAS